ncbi:MAG TPA: helix-turn-helix transcriptional regulator [Ruminiclostridium sp.]|nr:helix-turn-helix transcriptional regulator [Ruminiclostridium sp.]
MNLAIKEIKRLLPKSKFLSGTDKKRKDGMIVSCIRTRCGEKLKIDTEEKFRLADSLTQRERETFLLLLEGYTLKETAGRLGIGYSTANTYQTAVYRKLHVNSRAKLIINYMDIGGKSKET